MPHSATERRFQPAIIFAALFAGLFALHFPLLGLPYFWDEAGYYIPAARDLLLTGSLIPHSTPSNAHPPLVMGYLTMCWKLAGYSPLVTRTAMLLVAAFSLLGVFRLAERVADIQVALASTLCTALYPVFFVQSSLAQVDLAAAGLTFWGLLAYIEDRRWLAALWFSLAALAKETAVLTPLALLCSAAVPSMHRAGSAAFVERRAPSPVGAQVRGLTGEDARRSTAFRHASATLLIPCLPLALWYAYHRSLTGFTFGNPEFLRYNVQATIHPLRIFLAMLMRLWQTFGYMNLYLLTLAALLAMWLPALRDDSEGQERTRPRIAPSIQFTFLVVVVTYVAVMSIIGGAVLARYMLPAVPLVIIVFVSTIWRRVGYWRAVAGIVVLGFVAALFINPPYGFSLEDNLAYRDYILLHQRAETFLEARYPMARVLTAWPASGELSQPWLGYLTRPMQVVQMEDFTLENLMNASQMRPRCDVALVFSTKYEPPHPLLENWRGWERIKTKFFGYHRDVSPEAAAQVLGGRLVYSETRKGQWVGVIEMDASK